MAKIRGCLGVLKVKDLAATGAVATVYGVSNVAIAEDGELLDVSEIGTCAKEKMAGAIETTGTFDLWMNTDTATANHTDLTVANDISFEWYPGGSGSGNPKFTTPTGGANINNVSRAGGVEGAATFNCAFTVNGALTATSVP